MTEPGPIAPGVDVTTLITNYRKLLTEAWPSVTTLVDDKEWSFEHSTISRWQQACWELFVEEPLLKQVAFLESFHPGSHPMRVQFPGVVPRYRIVAVSKDADRSLPDAVVNKRRLPPKPLRLCHFVTLNEQSEVRAQPPFDFVCLDDDTASRDLRRFVAPFNDFIFCLDSN